MRISFASRLIPAIWCTVSVLIVAHFSIAAVGSTLIKMDLATLVTRSELVVEGQAEDVYAQWDNTQKMIFTYVSCSSRRGFEGYGATISPDPAARRTGWGDGDESSGHGHLQRGRPSDRFSGTAPGPDVSWRRYESG